MYTNTLIIALDRFLEAAADIARMRALGPIERRLEAAMMRAFALQERAFLRRFAKVKPLFAESLREALADTDWGPQFDDAAKATASDFINPIEVAVTEALAAGGEATLADLMVGGSFNLANPRAVAYLRDYGANLVAGIDDTTRQYIKTIITDGIDQGWSYNQMAKAISDRYAEFRIGRPQAHIESRAHMIAVTESGNAYCRGNAIVAEDLASAGLDMEKHWIVTGGEICEICLGNEAQGWIPIDQAWSGGVMEPLQHPSCRCAAGYRRRGAGQAQAPMEPSSPKGRALQADYAKQIQPYQDARDKEIADINRRFAAQEIDLTDMLRLHGEANKRLDAIADRIRAEVLGAGA